MINSVLSVFPEGIASLLLYLVRAGFVGGTAVSLGSFILAWWGITPDDASSSRIRRRLERFGCWGLPVAMLCSICWWPLVSMEMTGTRTFSEARPLMGVVLWQTNFGSELRLRFVLLVMAFVFALVVNLRFLSSICKEWRGAILVILSMTILLQPLMGHGVSVSAGYLLPLALHALAASIWIGCLPGLWAICRGFPNLAEQALGRFSWLGLICVCTIALTGLVQTLGLLASWSGLYSTAYGVIILLKCVLMICMLILAAINRFYWTPKASNTPSGLQRTLLLELVLGGVILLVAAVLSGQPPPGMGMMNH